MMWTHGGRMAVGFLGLWLLFVPSIASSAFVFRLSGALVMVLYAVSFNLLLGGTGLLSFGHGAYFGLGAYGIGLTLRAGFSFPVAMAAALAVAVLGALLVGYIALRATGVYFAFLTLSLGLVFYLLTFRLRDITGGSDGLPGIRPTPVELGPLSLPIGGVQRYYYVILILVAISVGVLYLIHHSSLGHVLRSIREDASRTAFLGLNVRRYQLVAFVIAGFFAGVAGALHAPLTGIASPTLFWWVFSALPIVMTLLGGVMSFWGPVVGAFAFEGFRYVTSGVVRGIDIYVGLLIIIVVLAFPSGIVGFIVKLRYGRGRRGDDEAPPGGASDAAGRRPSEVVPGGHRTEIQ